MHAATPSRRAGLGLRFALAAALVAGCDDELTGPQPDRPIPGAPERARPGSPPLPPKKPPPRPEPGGPATPTAVAATGDAGAQVAPTPPTPPDPTAKTPEPVASPPSKKQLAAAFLVRYRAGNGLAMSSTEVVVEGDSRAGKATRLSVGSLRGGQPTNDFARHRLDAKLVARFLAQLDRSKWWELGSDGQMGTDGTDHALEVRRGDYVHHFRVYIGCACADGVRPPGRPSADCKCPQLSAMDQVRAFVAGLPASTRVKDPATKRVPFAAPKMAALGKTPPRGRACLKEPTGQLTCDDLKCFEQKTALACFRSPFLDAHPGEWVKPEPLRSDTRKAEKTPAEVPPWAVELENGLRCHASARTDQRQSYACLPPGKGDGTDREGSAHLSHVFTVGKTVYAVTGGHGRDTTVLAATKAWK